MDALPEVDEDGRIAKRPRTGGEPSDAKLMPPPPPSAIKGAL